MRPRVPAVERRLLDTPPLSGADRRERLTLELQIAALAFAGIAAFPRLAYRLRWPTRLRGRRLVAYIAFMTAEGFAMRQALLPWMQRQIEQHRQLVDQLGRHPTDDEYRQHFAALRRERRVARRGRLSGLRRPRAARRATR